MLSVRGSEIMYSSTSPRRSSANVTATLDTHFAYQIFFPSFWVDKNTFGKDEVTDIVAQNGGKIENAFWLVVEGYSKTTFTSLHVGVVQPAGTFSAVPGITVSANGTIDFEKWAAKPENHETKVDGVPVFDCHYGTSNGRNAIKIDKLLTGADAGWLGADHE